MNASDFVRTVQKRQGFYIACLEEIAYKKGFIEKNQLEKLATEQIKTEYGQYLMDLVNEG